MQLIAYYRVSTQRQGQSGLGLDAQRTRIQEIAAARGAEVVAEFTETESGRKNDRPQLAAAMAMARETGAAIAVAKLDRLARDAEFVLRLSREAEQNGMGGPVRRPAGDRRHHQRRPNDADRDGVGG